MNAGGPVGYVILLFLVGIAISVAYTFVWPHVRSFKLRNPWLTFPRSSLKLKTWREETRSRGYGWFAKSWIREHNALASYWSFLWFLPASFATIFGLAYLLTSITGVIETGLLRVSWQAQLTITSLSFIVLIFLLDQIYRSRYREGVVQQFFASSHIMPVLYFSLASAAAIAYFSFTNTTDPVPPFFVNATFFLFTGTVVGIGYVYYRVAKLIFQNPLDDLTVNQIKNGVDLQLKEIDRQNIAGNLLTQTLPEYVAIGSNDEGRAVTAEELGVDGFISDVNLGVLKNACEDLELQDDVGDGAVLINVGLGQEIHPTSPIISVNPRKIDVHDLPQRFGEAVADAVHCTPERPWSTGDALIDRNMDHIGDSCRQAIGDLNSSGLQRHIGFYTDLLRYATDLNKEVAPTEGGTPVPISSLVDQIYKEFYRIFEAAADTGNRDVILAAGAEMYGLVLRFHRQGEVHLFEKSLGYYRAQYRALASNRGANEEQIHDLLSSFNNLLTVLTADLGRSQSMEEVEQNISNLTTFYDELENLFRDAIEENDARTFNNVWDLGSEDFVMVRPESDVFELQRRMDNSDNEEEVEHLQQVLAYKQRQQEAVEDFQAAFWESKFVAAAWAYQVARQGDLDERVFQDMFSESIRQFSFDRLAEIYLRMFDEPRLDLFRWEFEDSDIFKGARTGRPAVFTWLQEFFCVMGLLFLDVEGYEVDALEESDNPLAEFDIDRTSYPDLEETIKSISEEQLALTGVAESEFEDLEEKKELFLAFHHQMEEILERREENDVIDADLDPEKVSNFEQSYIDGFEGQFVVRQVFEDLGWLEVRSYDDELDVEPSGFRAFYQKGGFIPDPPAEFVHHLDQRISNHVDFVMDTWFGENQANLDIERVDGFDKVPEQIARICLDHKESGRTPQAIIVGGYRISNVVRNSDYFGNEFSTTEDIVGGFSYDGEPIPVYSDHGRQFGVMILAGENKPVEVKEHQRDDETVFVEIEKVTEDLLKEINPNDYQELSDEEIRDKLQTVYLRVLYYAELKPADTFGTKILINN